MSVGGRWCWVGFAVVDCWFVIRCLLLWVADVLIATAVVVSSNSNNSSNSSNKSNNSDNSSNSNNSNNSNITKQQLPLSLYYTAPWHKGNCHDIIGIPFPYLFHSISKQKIPYSRCFSFVLTAAFVHDNICRSAAIVPFSNLWCCFMTNSFHRSGLFG